MNKKHKKIVFIIFLISMLVNTIGLGLNTKTAVAATNLLDGGSFEGDIHGDWGLWQDPNISRGFDFYRAYDAPFGHGSYSAAIDASGNPGDAFSAILSSSAQNTFSVDTTQDYYLLFYAKATRETEIITYLQRANDYSAITEIQARTITNNWQRYMISMTPSASAESLLAFVLGNMPDSSTFYLDGVQLIKANSTLTTKTINGYIGESDKFLKMNNISNFSEEEIEIELPFYDRNSLTRTRVHPDRMTNTGVYFTMPEKSFAGIGQVYINNIFVGQFDYSVKVKINSFHPSLVRLNQDLIIDGEGFSPLENSVFLIVDSSNIERKKEKIWLSPESFDSELKQMRFVLPAGAISGRMVIQSSFTNMDGVEVINKSKPMSYKIKPALVATNWSERGYEHVGDKLKIYGLGFGMSPKVRYYNDNGEVIETIPAKLIEVGDIELIEVATTKKTNNFNITVVSDGVESDRSDALSYLAKPVLSGIKTKYSRRMISSNQEISATKVGDTITLNGLSFQSDTDNVQVEFQGYNTRITSELVSESNKGTSLQVVVPVGALNGYINIVVNGADSNYMPIEIIPTLVSVNPDPIVPGEDMVIQAYGIGDNINLAKINFKVDSEIKSIVIPDSISIGAEFSTIHLRAPYDLSYQDTRIELQYDRWQDNGSTVLNIQPHIIRAGIDMDNKVLSIIGYGFSITPKENVITYKYADENQTIIEPKVRILGVYPTEEGQEIRIKILDDYYFGHVSVQVGEYTSNEVNFGPISIKSISRRVEYIESSNAMMGVLYIKGYNFGSGGGVLVGDRWADVHYRSDFFIIAVVPEENLYDGPVLVARE